MFLPIANSPNRMALLSRLLSDFKRTVVKDYGVFNEEQGFGNRATFVIDKDGIIQHIDEGNVAIDPTTAEDTCNILSHKKTTP